MGFVVLGAGAVGGAVAGALGELGPTVVLTRTSHPALAARSAEAVALVAATCAAVRATAVVDAVGRLAGSDAELEEANATWATWVATDVLAALDPAVRLVHLGSAAEYGDPGSATPITEDRPPAPSSPYGRTKRAGSDAVLAARAGGADAVVARVFNVAGPDLAPTSPLGQIRDDVLALPPTGGVVRIGEPATVRDFVAIADLGRAVAGLATRSEEVPPVVNVCSGTGVSFGDLARALGAATGRVVEVEGLGWTGIPAVVGDPSRLARVTGVRPDGSAAAVVAACLAPPS